MKSTRIHRPPWRCELGLEEPVYVNGEGAYPPGEIVLEGYWLLLLGLQDPPERLRFRLFMDEPGLREAFYVEDGASDDEIQERAARVAERWVS